MNGLSPQSGEPDTAAYRDGLFALDEIVRVLRNVPDPQARYEAAELDVLRSLAQQQVTGGLAQDEFDGTGVLLPLLGPLDRHRTRLDVGQCNDAVFGLANDLLGDAEHVAGLERSLLRQQRGVDDGGEVIARPHFGDATHSEDAVFREGWHGATPIPPFGWRRWLCICD